MRPPLLFPIAFTLAAMLVASPARLAGQEPPRWPGEEWPVATPESRGLSGAALAAAAEYALQYGGGSGCVIRNGYLVQEWGSPATRAAIKSCTKGAVGAALLGLAVDAGLVGLDDPARGHYPQLGLEKPENAARGWLPEITVRQLATMTAGFDNGRPPTLSYRPGTAGIYCNDTSNMLAELLTLRFGEDLRDVFRREVAEPLGLPPAEWAWRNNQYRAREVGGLPSREIASGITITHGALARLGYLYLREGEWNGRRILSREFIREATRPTELPAPRRGYAFYWVSNANGDYPGLPRDAYWAVGLGDSFVLVCPSLDLVVVRLGTGSRASHLPGPADSSGPRVAAFVRRVIEAVPGDELSSAGGLEPPYPASPAIRELRWAPADTIVRAARGSDNWPLTWGDDDHLYTAYGDGWGFDPRVPEKLSLGFARVEGPPDALTGVNIRSPEAEQKGDGRRGRKASGMLMVDGVLYMWVRNAENSVLAWSADRGQTWTWSDWQFTTSFGCPTFLNFGRNYAGARDDYVYVYSQDADDAYTGADRAVLARVAKNRLREREAYEFFVELTPGGEPVWTRDIDRRGAVFNFPGRCYRSGITYNAGIGRYLWSQTIPRNGEIRFEGGFGVYDAPAPWGPWTTVYFTERWDVGPGESGSFPTKWMSADGRTVHLVFSGDDYFAVRRATLVLADAPPPDD